MSAKRRNSSRKTKSAKAIDRPFDPDVIERAEDLAHRYRLLIEEDDEGQYVGTVLEMQEVIGVGGSPDECVEQTRELLVSALATMIEEGDEPPAPASANKRTEQVNIRLTQSEKLLLEDAARAGGFRGVSDYLRSTGLSRQSGAG